MHVTLIHKPDAGDGAYSGQDLVELLRQAGHAVTYHSLDDDEWLAALEAPGDAVLIGGGDGTVGTVALRLVGTGTPFAILPLGTANNLATALGWRYSPEDIIPRLEHARRRPFDVGVARGPWGADRFVEGVGLGAFARAMAFVKANKKEVIVTPPGADEEIERDLHLVRAFVTESSPARWTIDIDDERIQEPILLLEVLNSGLIGPNLELAPDADLGDGFFDIVVVGETERDALLGYLDARIQGRATPLALPTRRAHHVRIRAEAARTHVDDQVWPPPDEPPPAADAPFDIDIRVEPAALSVLVPA